MPRLSENNLLITASALLVVVFFGAVFLYLYHNFNLNDSQATKTKNLVASKPTLFLQSTCEHGKKFPTISFSRPQSDLTNGVIQYSSDDQFNNAMETNFLEGSSEAKVEFESIEGSSVSIFARWRFQSESNQEWSEVAKIRIDQCQ
jgi:hypothetical protein